MGTHKILSLSIIFLSISTWVQAASDPVVLKKECAGCHAIPPGSGVEHGPFKPGAHAAHAELECDQCHLSGAAGEHVDGVISLKPQVEYQYGSKVPWPSLGSGSCGGLGFPYPPAGCHERMPKAKCFWLPGKNCRPAEGP